MVAKTMRSFRLILSALVCAVLASCNDTAETKETQPQIVRVVQASQRSYQPTAEITGEVRARVQSDLAFRVGGKVIERLVDVGSEVRAGDVLARIDDSEQHADVDVARAGLQSEQANVSQKTLAFKRYSALLQSRSISQATYDQAQEELLTAKAMLKVAEAALATARDALSYTELKADVDGVITGRDIEVGQVVSAAEVAFTLAQNGPRDAVFNVFEAFFLDGRPNTVVTIAPINDLDRKVQASIREISPTIDTSTGTVRVKAVLPQDAQWVLGTPVLGIFRSPERSGFILPSRAMTSDGGTQAVWVVDPENRLASLRKVSVSRYRSSDFIVTDGIASGDLIVTEGGKFLREGRSVAWEEK